ncbi:hypothetical protein OF83DRAFT_1180585 [Amylostereum chailletii]|nr:hypothetical protein OF83DRAFT_1180585 [Amylostereum chailletii]
MSSDDELDAELRMLDGQEGPGDIIRFTPQVDAKSLVGLPRPLHRLRRHLHDGRRARLHGYTVTRASDTRIGVPQSMELFHWADDTEAGTSLGFCLKSEVTHVKVRSPSGAMGRGYALVRTALRKLVKVDSVAFDPRRVPGQSRPRVLQVLQQRYRPRTPFNPIHINPYVFADHASLPGTIAHGM